MEKRERAVRGKKPVRALSKELSPGVDQKREKRGERRRRSAASSVWGGGRHPGIPDEPPGDENVNAHVLPKERKHPARANPGDGRPTGNLLRKKR